MRNIISSISLSCVLAFVVLETSKAFMVPNVVRRNNQHVRGFETLLQESRAEESVIETEKLSTLDVNQLLNVPKQQKQIDLQTVPLLGIDQDSDEENNAFAISNLLWRGSIVLLCALWASNFPTAKMIMAEPGVDSGLYALTRFSAAALALLPGSISSIRKGNLDWETAKGAAICGSWVAFGYLGQTLGLLTTTASKSCVICSMHCVFVAAVAEYTRSTSVPGRKFNLEKLIPAMIAVLGVAIIELKGAGGAPNSGDLLSFAQPIGFGIGYLQLEGLMHKKPEAALPVSAIKLIVVALASFGMFEFLPLATSGIEEWSFRVPDFTPILSSSTALLGVLYTGLITTALALWVESIAFKRVPATDASIILATEPLFAASAAAAFLGETFGYSDYIGATLIVGACVMAILQGDTTSEEDNIVGESNLLP